jgi:hypothetical protein
MTRHTDTRSGYSTLPDRAQAIASLRETYKDRAFRVAATGNNASGYWFMYQWSEVAP